jgi:hypothetical protein
VAFRPVSGIGGSRGLQAPECQPPIEVASATGLVSTVKGMPGPEGQSLRRSLQGHECPCSLQEQEPRNPPLPLFAGGSTGLQANFRKRREQGPSGRFQESEGAGAFRPLNASLQSRWLQPRASYRQSKECPGLKANPSAALFRGMNAPAPSEKNKTASRNLCGTEARSRIGCGKRAGYWRRAQRASLRG